MTLKYNFKFVTNYIVKEYKISIYSNGKVCNYYDLYNFFLGNIARERIFE